MVDGLAHRAGLDLLAGLEQSPGDVGAVGAAEDAHRQFGPAGTHQPGQADDLAAPDGEVRLVDDDPFPVLRVVDRPVLDAQQFLADGRGVVGVAVVQLPADHPLDDPVLADTG